MQEEQNKLTPYINFLKNNKNNLYIIGAIILLFLLSTGLIALIVRPSNKSIPNSTNPNPSQPASQSQISPSINNPAPTLDGPIITPDPTQAALIENQTKPQITPAVPYTYTNIKEFGNTWATTAISNPSIEGGGLIMKKVNGSWKIVEGPGTYFPPDLLQSIGAPQELIDSFNPEPSTSVSPSPSDSPSFDAQ